MAHHEVAEVNVKKELLFSLTGIIGFLAVVALIAISAFLRPAGEHANLAELNKTDIVTTEQATNNANAEAQVSAASTSK